MLSACESGIFRAEFTEANLEKDAVLRRKDLQEVKVTLIPQGIRVTAATKTILGDTRIQVDGTLVVTDGHLLALSNPQIQLNGKPVDAKTAASLIATLNPLFDTDKDLGTPGVLRLEQAEVQNGVLVLSGQVILPTKPSILNP
jgi:hypothetical protein